MKFLSVNFRLNQTFFVENLAFEQAIKLAFKRIKGVKLISSTVTISKTSELFIEIEAEKDASKSYKSVIMDIQTKIDEYIFNLIGSKPSNVEIYFSEGKTPMVELTKIIEVKVNPVDESKVMVTTENKEIIK